MVPPSTGPTLPTPVPARQATVVVEPISKRVTVPVGTTIYEAIKQLGHALTSACGGAGTCGKCRIVVVAGASQLSLPTSSEAKFLSEDQLATGLRLACQAHLEQAGVVRVMIPPESLEKKGRILIEGRRVDLPVAPATRKLRLEVPAPDLHQPRADFRRLKMALAEETLTVPPALLRRLPEVVREADGIVTVTTLVDAAGPARVLGIQPGDRTHAHFGLAVDVGTTTVVAYLTNLLTGEIVATSSMLNPQVAHGEDVVTRLTHAQEPGGLTTLHEAVLGCLTHLAEDACILAGVHIHDVHEVHVVGNTAMHHLLLGLPTRYLGLAPFTPVVQAPVDYPAREVGLPALAHANVHVLPVIAGYVGADTVGVILAARLDEIDEYTLTFDVGTNGEIVLGNKDTGLLAGSCAAGSALEGAHITSGMRAAGGAIEKVRVEPGTLAVTYRTINDDPPVGLCGSGVIDVVAELIRASVLTRSGNFSKDPGIVEHERLTRVGDARAFTVAFADETPTGTPVLFTQDDVREVQLAKSAFYAGAKLLLAHRQTTFADLDQILLAGAFGSYLDKDNVHFLGMIPDVPADRIHQIGNAAGVGAQYSLINREFRAKAARVAVTTDYLELTTQKAFSREYAMAMHFPHMRYKREFPSLAGVYDDVPLR